MLNSNRSFDAFAKHLSTNAIGPIITAQKLLQTRIPIGSITFMSSDSGSTSDFRAFEDGYETVDFVHEIVLRVHSRFAAYAASKAALNQMLRVRILLDTISVTSIELLQHMAAELQRKKIYTTILAMHPGEVTTLGLSSFCSCAVILTVIRDMANVSVAWEIEGIISAEESVSRMLQVVEKKTIRDTGTFWTWEGIVSLIPRKSYTWRSLPTLATSMVKS